MIRPELLRRLERLHILARTASSGGRAGRRLMRRPGRSQEFFDYRHYSTGDELRYVDWNVYARHGTLFVKEFAAEENVHVAIAVDVSASMGIGRPPKIRAAADLALAMAYVGLCQFDSVSLLSFSDRLRMIRTFVTGKERIHELVLDLDGLRAGGRTEMARAFREPVPRLRGRTVAVLISDFLDLEGFREALSRLLSQRIHVHLIQVLAPEELDPKLTGRIRLRDVETGRERDLYLSAESVRRYRDRLNGFLESVEKTARGHEIRFVRIRSPDPLEAMVVEVAHAGILEAGR